MRSVLFLAALLAAVGSSSAAPAADRLTDRELRALAERIDDGRDHFEDALDEHFKRTVMRGPSGDLEVEHYLDDFRESVAEFKERLESGHAANAEAATVLRQASNLDAFFRRRSPGARSAGDWNRLAADLRTLAGAYGAGFPLPDEARVGRMDDHNVAAVADEVARTAKQFRQSLDDELGNDPRVDKRARDAIVDQADRLEETAKDVRDRVDDGQSGSSELERLLAQASRFDAILAEYDVPASKGVWTRITAPLQALASAYRVRWPSVR